MRLLILIFLGLLLAACGQDEPEHVINPQQLKEPLIKIDSTQTQLERERIESFLKRYKWDMIESGTGLSYMVYQEGFGVEAKQGMYATVHFTISLLDGTECYTSLDGKPEEFLIGMDDVESGLHEGVGYMKVGDKAKLILPSHLAHGLVGDQNKIPPRSTIIYDIELLALR